ncbi:cytochrome c [Sediminibacterium ginsengisoli]|uniref:Cytochrome c553 n=1 Tax=Sediminibacterium ginsengisoli TaxID=413434 RepID=A0A1T4RKD7_9BACT|nr:hypothetical protein [Sediminibacterium ginsengisoli]SKA16433.1 Cytochrome c553 [Sediminibacterium ginsengisoli]
MKKILVALSLTGIAMFFAYCSSTKTASQAAVKVVKISYQQHVATILETNCAPCHFPGKGGNKKALDSYAAASANADEILRRIQLNPGERGFMPMRHPKLSDSTIAVIKQWKTDGLGEK